MKNCQGDILCFLSPVLYCSVYLPTFDYQAIHDRKTPGPRSLAHLPYTPWMFCRQSWS